MYIQDTIDRDQAKKPEKQETIYHGDQRLFKTIEHLCSACGLRVYEINDFCGRCGQRLDWKGADNHVD